MQVTPTQQRNLYLIFVGLFAVSITMNAWNIYQDHKLRKLQKEDLEKKNGKQ